MTSHLYNREILRLATSLAGQARLRDFHGTADRRSPTCGSRVIVDVNLDEARRIAEIGMEVSACALGQASAALVLAHAPGLSAADLRDAADALRSWLGGEDVAVDFWPGIEVFATARDYTARHPSILLAFEAAADAASALRNGEAA